MSWDHDHRDPIAPLPVSVKLAATKVVVIRNCGGRTP